jgi:hypothetical protein
MSRLRLAVTVAALTATTAAAILLVGTMVVLLPRPATAKPEFAAKTGFPCGECHVSKTGGGTLKPYGLAFKANGFEVPKKKK